MASRCAIARADRAPRRRRTPELIEPAILRARAELRAGPRVSRLGARDRRLDRARRAASARALTTACHAAPREEIVRYERSRPGELVHVDVKKLGRILTARPSCHRRSLAPGGGKAGWLYLYVAIDVTPARLRPHPPRRDAQPRARLPRSARPLLRPTGSSSSACSATTAPASSALAPAHTRIAVRKHALIARRPTARPTLHRTLLEPWPTPTPTARAHASPLSHRTRLLQSLPPTRPPSPLSLNTSLHI